MTVDQSTGAQRMAVKCAHLTEPLVVVEDLSKKFCRDLRRSLWYGLCDIGAELALRDSRERRLRPSEFWVLRRASFTLRRGERLGVIGRNGTGKTTLLRLLNGLIKPDGGRVMVRGRVGGLIALTAGFDPLMTGRENIRVSASAFGLSQREQERELDSILEFAELGEFIDAPVQSYSAGMQVRLGFAVASALKPDILLLDEVLAVGDEGFRHKCFTRLARMQEDAAVILVSHSMEMVAQLCDRVLYLKDGIPCLYESAVEGIEAYLADYREHPASGSPAVRVVYDPVTEVDLEIRPDTVAHGDSFEAVLRFKCRRALRDPVIVFLVRDSLGRPMLCWRTDWFGQPVEIPAGGSELRFEVGPVLLQSGRYGCVLSVREARSLERLVWYWDQSFFNVEGRSLVMYDVPFLMPYHGHEVRLTERVNFQNSLPG